MARLIDADRLERAVTFGYIETCHDLTPKQIDMVAKFTARILGEIAAAPTHKAEPIVRCKDCKHFDTKDCPIDGLINVNGYCDRGERKDDPQTYTINAGEV